MTRLDPYRTSHVMQTEIIFGITYIYFVNDNPADGGCCVLLLPVRAL